MVARWLRRDGVGIDLNADYLALAAERILTPAPVAQSVKPQIVKPQQLAMEVT